METTWLAVAAGAYAVAVEWPLRSVTPDGRTSVPFTSAAAVVPEYCRLTTSGTPSFPGSGDETAEIEVVAKAARADGAAHVDVERELDGPVLVRSGGRIGERVTLAVKVCDAG